MSRSIHATRSHREYRRMGAIDWSALSAKRSTKEGALRQRQTPDDLLPITSVRDVPIRIVDDSPLLYFPATVDAMRAVLEALPQGVTTGLEEVRLCIGRRTVNDYCEEFGFDIVDRFGRGCFEPFPGVMVPMVLGCYERRAHTIQVFGYARTSRRPLTRRQQIDLERQMLTTLVHEVIHHHDATDRMGRGRSWRSYHAHTETYTERNEGRWVIEAVVPYLRGKYGDTEAMRTARLALRPRGHKRYRQGLSNRERRRRRREIEAALSPSARRWIKRVMQQPGPSAEKAVSAALRKVRLKVELQRKRPRLRDRRRRY